jgi:hypothetical protein
MTTQAIFHPLCVRGNAFAAQALKLRAKALGTWILWMNGQHRAHRVAQ